MPAEHIAWINDRFVPLSQASLSVFDAGVTTAATVTERLRTFQHEPFLLDKHIIRLIHSAEAAFIPPPVSPEELDRLIREVVRRNAAVVPAEADLSVSAFLTAGARDVPTLCIHATPIPASSLAVSYADGVALATPSTRAMPPDTLSPAIKTRSRLHWHVADAEASRAEPGSKALLLDQRGHVTETSTGNIFLVRNDELLTPDRSRTLRGISQQYVIELATRLGRTCREAALSVDDLLAADEVFVTSSVYCMLPVIRLNGTPIGDGRPGPDYHRLLAAWSEAVGVEIARQMRFMASGRPTALKPDDNRQSGNA